MASEDVLKRAGKFLIDRTDDMDAWYMVGDLAAEVRELRKDKARLDWLDASFCDGEARIVTVTNIWWRTPGESTCREAIDAAMGATENG